MNEEIDKKVLIMNSAETIFTRFGYHKTSMDDIAKEAGIGKGTIYYYYKSKEDILLELVNYYHELLKKKVNEEMEKKNSFKEKFQVLIELPMMYAVNKYPVYFEALSTPSKSLLKKINQFKMHSRTVLKERIISLIDEAKKNHQIREDISIVELAEVLVRWFFVGDDDVQINLTQDGFKKFIKDYKLFIDIILNGIKIRS